MVVIGAGVIGLAAARALAMAGRDVVVLERHDVIGSETSSRNSEVIHAGIYYATGTVKAEMCVRGKKMLYEYCRSHGVAHERVGKIIVATTEDQFDDLRGYQEQARANGVGELRWLTQHEIEALEPAVSGMAGVYSDTTGIIDSHGFMLALQGDLEAHGGAVSFLTEVTSVEIGTTAPRVRCADFDLEPTTLINAAGLSAPDVARQLGVETQGYFAKGHYYTLSGRSPFSHLVYPIAEAGGLGVHVTLDLGGQAKFGPDVQWIDAADYDFEHVNRERFIEAIQKYYPGLDPDRLQPGYTGIRPKLAPQGGPATDFVIQGPRVSGVPGTVNLLGIESPGLTAALAIAERVVALVADD